MSLLLQLLYTLLFCILWDESRTVFADNDTNINDNDKVCSYLAIEYGDDTQLTAEKQSYSLYNRSVWSLPQTHNHDIFVSYDGWTHAWEVILPTTASQMPNIYRVESNTTVPPSTQWTHKWTQTQIHIQYTCYDHDPSLEPIDLIYPHTLASCAQIINYLNDSIPNGIYFIELSGRTLQVFCDFDIENEFAWTLVESFSQHFASSLYSLSFNLGINAKDPNQRDAVYRLPMKQMNELQATSTHNLVSCNFDSSLTRDYILLDNALNGWNILSKTRSICRPVKEINIRGHQCNDGTAPFWTLSNHFHVDSSYTSDECTCDEWTHTAIKNEDDFGQYSYYNTQHSCAVSNTSTTNFWMGSRIHIRTIPPTTIPTATTPLTTPTPSIVQPTVTCAPCPECATQEPCASFINDCSICPTIPPSEPCTTLSPSPDEPCPTFECNCPTLTPEPCTTVEPFVFTTDMCPPCTTQEDIPHTTVQDVLTTTAIPCPTCESCDECEPCANVSSTFHPETSAEPCPTAETIIVYRNTTCPPSTPCPTMDTTTQGPTVEPTTSPSGTIIIADCAMCAIECKDWFSTTKRTTPTPTVSPTGNLLITDEPKVTTPHYTMVELLVRYDSVNDLCPSDMFDDYLLELSTCQVFDTESVYCEVKDITSITTIQSVAASSQRRRQLTKYDGFDIAVLMQISAADEQGLETIDRLVNHDDFAYELNEKWHTNADSRGMDLGGEVMSIITEEIVTPAPTVTLTTTTLLPTRADYYLDDKDVSVATKGILNLQQSIGLLVTVGLVLLCLGLSCAYCCDKWNKSKLKHEDQAEGRSMYDTEPDNEYALPSNKSRDGPELESADRQMPPAAHAQGAAPEEAEQRHHLLMEEDEKAPSPQVVIEVEDQNHYTDEFDSVLNINGYAEFEDSNGDKTALMALPATLSTPRMHYRSTPQHFVRQNGPVISQMSVQKYHDLVTQKQWLDQLEHQLTEIQASQPPSQQPGAYNAPEAIRELHTELKQVNTGMKKMLTRLGYGMQLPDAPVEDEEDTITACILYARYLQDEIIAKYGGDIIKELLGDDDGLDMKELEEKRNKLQLQSKRSSRKVSKTYLAMQKGGGKQKLTLNSTQPPERGRGRSRGGQSDETGSMSGVSEAEKELEAMNDNDVMRQYVLAPMKSTSQTYKQKEDDIMKSMPDSPSVSSVRVLTPRSHHHDTLILASDASRRRGWSRHNKNRDSTEYELTKIEDEVVRYNDPPPKHPKKKYSGYVPKAVDRVDTTGKLPTPSQSFSDENGTQTHHKNTAADLEKVVSQHLQVFQQDETQFVRTHKSNAAPPRPPPPSRGDEKEAKENEDEDNQFYDEDDDDLKEPFIEMDPGTMTYEMQFADLARDRGNSNASGSTSDSGEGSLNSPDSSSDSMSELSKSRQVPRKPMVEVGYASNAPIHSESISKDTMAHMILPVTPAIETSIEKKKDKKKEKEKENDKSKSPKKKKKKKIKPPKKPKIKSPFFESDAAITASKKKTGKAKKKKKKEPERPRFKYRGKGTGVTPSVVKTKETGKKGKKKTVKSGKTKDKDKGKSKKKEKGKKGAAK